MEKDFSRPAFAKEWVKQQLEAQAKGKSVENLTMTDPLGITYRLLTKPYVEQASKVLAEAFAHREAMCLHLGLDLSVVERFTRVICEMSVQTGLSLIALDGDRVIAVLIDGAFGGPLPPIDEEVTAQLFPILALIGQMEKRFAEGKGKELQEYLTLSMLGIDLDYTSKGISFTIVYLAVAQGILKGFKYCLAEATNPHSIPILEKMNFTRQFSVVYDDFELNGQRPFKGMVDTFHKKFGQEHAGQKPCTECVLMTREAAYEPELKEVAKLVAAAKK